MAGKIALYPVVLLEIALIYLFAHSIDEYKFDGTQRTISLKVFKWYFRHSKKRAEILTITFIRKLLVIVLFSATTALFVLTFFVDIDGDEGLLIFGAITVAIALYLACLSTIENRYKKKYRKEHKAEEAAKVQEMVDEYNNRKKNKPK